MKVERCNDLLIVYIYDKKILNQKVEDLIKYIFNILEKYYNVSIINSYEIKLYINKLYGKILEMKEIYNDDNNIINIKLNVLKDKLFLYEIEDPINYKNSEIYYYNSYFYLNPKNIDINLIENSKIIYDKEVYKIIGKGIKL